MYDLLTWFILRTCLMWYGGWRPRRPYGVALIPVQIQRQEMTDIPVQRQLVRGYEFFLTQPLVPSRLSIRSGLYEGPHFREGNLFHFNSIQILIISDTPSEIHPEECLTTYPDTHPHCTFHGPLKWTHTINHHTWSLCPLRWIHHWQICLSSVS